MSTLADPAARRSWRRPSIDRGWLMRHTTAVLADTPAVMRRATAYGRSTPRRLSAALSSNRRRPIPI